MSHSPHVSESPTSIRATWPRVVLALMGVGALLRLLLLAYSWNDPLDPDANEYLLLARRYSFAHPWSASFREPLWRAIVKVVTSPFDYSPHAQRIFTLVVSIAVLPVMWLLLRKVVRSRGLSDRVAMIALAVVALSAQTVREAPRGLREDLCMMLFLGFAATLLMRPSRLREAAVVAIPVAVLSVVRWELAAFATFLALVFALARRANWATPVLAVLAIVIVSGPWLLANKDKHGSLSYNSKVHATYYWKQEQPAAVRAQYRSAPADDPPVHLTWSQYYLDYLGPTTAAKRFVKGYVKVTGKLVASQVVPRGVVVSALGNNQRSRGWELALAAAGIVFLAAAFWIVRRLRRMPRPPALFWEALAITALAICPYAPLASIGLEMRVLMFVVPVLGLAVGVLADMLLQADTREVAHEPSLDAGAAPAGS